MRERHKRIPKFEALDDRLLLSAMALPHSGLPPVAVTSKAQAHVRHATGTVSGLATVDSAFTMDVIFAAGAGRVRPLGKVALLDAGEGGSFVNHYDGTIVGFRGLFGFVGLQNRKGEFVGSIDLSNATINSLTAPTTTMKYELDRITPPKPDNMDPGIHKVGLGTAVISFPQGLPRSGGPALPFTISLYPKR